ncbi:MAG: ATP synthase F0 subunit C [Deltaproteobacteria bacterium]|nr:ATP synthase F0 subunit C [Deltaproteobacteria bacterium]
MQFRKILVSTSSTLILFLIASSAFAQALTEGAAAAEEEIGLRALGAGVAIGLAALGGSIGQGISSGFAFQGIARNPKMTNKIFTFMILSLALIESLVIYALVISFMVKP